MKLNFSLLFLLITIVATAQETEFALQGKLTDNGKNPVTDAYILNIRNTTKCYSTERGIFELRVLPTDTLIISHIAFLRKVVTVYELLVDPVIVLESDTVNIKPVNVTGTNLTDYEKAMKNINSIKFDTKPKPSDNITEQERTGELMKTENRVLRSEASSLKITSFSPSEAIGKLSEKRKRRKASKEYDSTKKLPEKEED